MTGVAATPELLPPPRDVPAGLRLRILAQYDVVASTMFTVPAALILAIAALSPWPAFLRWGCVLVGAILLILALQAAIPALVAATATLRRMREGTLTVGRMLSCRYAWDKKSADTPYAEFLGDFAGIATRSQMGKFTGCMIRLIVAVFVVPFVLIIAITAFALIARQLGLLGGGQVAGDVDAGYLGQFTMTFAIGTVLIAAFLWVWRKLLIHAAGRMVERRRNERIAAGVYEEHLRAEREKPANAIRLKDPLPADHASPSALVCRIEYAAGGEVLVASGRARLSDRLDMTGIEPLLHDKLHPGRIDLLAGLPPDVAVSDGRWRDLSPIGPAAGLAFAGASALIAFTLFVLNVHRLLA